MSNVQIVPIVKNNKKDPCNGDNYRPIAIASACSKMLEKILLLRLSDFIYSSDHQFGFKAKHGTDTCIFALKEVINYYLALNSPVFICFLDIKSAFDRISYSKLFSKLVSRGVPKYLICLLKNWYQNQSLFIRWGNIISEGFGMTNGIRQGSKLSPHLFNVYLDELNEGLVNSNLGCHIGGVPMNNFAYADDLALVGPSARAINGLLQICDRYAVAHDVIFSTTKSECMCIQSSSSSIRLNFLPNICLGKF